MNNEGKKTIWEKYQKEIANDKYFYLRSCVRQNFFPGSETTFIRILKEELGRDVFEDPAHTTCTGIGYHGDIVPLETTMTVVARQFALMTEAFGAFLYYIIWLIYRNSRYLASFPGC